MVITTDRNTSEVATWKQTKDGRPGEQITDCQLTGPSDTTVGPTGPARMLRRARTHASARRLRFGSPY